MRETKTILPDTYTRGASDTIDIVVKVLRNQGDYFKMCGPEIWNLYTIPQVIDTLANSIASMKERINNHE